MLTLNALFLVAGGMAHGLQFAIPSSPPLNSSSTPIKSPPLGLSIEFYAFPQFLNQSLASACMGKLEDVFGEAPPLRIGGVTQDRATYDENLESASTHNDRSLPDSFKFGDPFIELAAAYKGPVTFGLNRRLDDIKNTIAAAKAVQVKMPNLYAIEMGNEPNLFSDDDPIAKGEDWNATANAKSEVYWQKIVGDALNTRTFIQAGAFSGNAGKFNLNELADLQEESNTAGHVKTLCHHYYPQNRQTADLPQLMNHSRIVAGVQKYKPQIDGSQKAKKDFVFGETNSVSGGGAGICNTYGAGLWILDYMMQGVVQGAKQIMFHQGVTASCEYCWWLDGSIRASFYGAYTAALTLTGASRITQLDSGKDTYAAYVIYDREEKPIRALLYNSDYRTKDEREIMKFSLSGIPASSVSARRLTGDTTKTTLQKGNVTIAGQSFEDGTCELQGEEDKEIVQVHNGVASFRVGASEALIIDFKA